MASENCGGCQACRNFAIEPSIMPAPQTMGLCIVQDHQSQQLCVTGACGCSEFAKGEPARAEGASPTPRS